MASESMASESTSRTNEEIDFLSSMREKLPNYVVNCMLASGFDVPEVVCSMDVTDKPGNSIEHIEQFIAKNFADQDGYSNTYMQASSSLSCRFVFPPGHRMRIANFVLAVKKQMDAPKLAAKAPKRAKSIMKSKSTRSAMMSDSDIDTESIASVTKQVRKNIAMWIRKQRSKHLQDLKENAHFAIFVSYVRKSNDLSVSVKCIPCNSRIQLQRSAVKTSTFAVSNWTRHIKKCSILHSHPDSRTRPILSYLSPLSSRECIVQLTLEERHLNIILSCL